MTGRAVPAFDLDPVVVLAIGWLPLIEPVADERTADLTVGTHDRTGETQCIKVRAVALDVGAEVRYNDHVVEPDAKNRAAKQSLCLGLLLSLVNGLRAYRTSSRPQKQKATPNGRPP